MEVLEAQLVQATMVLTLYLVLLLHLAVVVLVVQLGALAVLLEVVDILLQQLLLAHQGKVMLAVVVLVMVHQF
jgi:hypothetical protein